MLSEQDKVNGRRIPLEMFNQGRLDLAEELFTSDYVEHVSLPPEFPTGIAGIQAFINVVRTGFPDFRYTIEDEIAEGDKIVYRLTATGTNNGEFLGMPATGKSATWSEIHICRMENGKLAEHWANVDNLGMLQQLGVIPAPG
jgi:steroid delta-isomerase-like uncharacterized protein